MDATATTKRTAEKVWLDYAEAAEYCGMHRSTLWRAVRTGELKAGGHGSAVRFHVDDLDAFLRGDTR